MLSSLNTAQTGLAASKASVENVMNNIANANTEGYKKRVVETSELSIADTRLWGRGVSVDDTVRITSQYMYDNIIKENSKETYYSELSFMLENVEAVFEETDESGLSASLDRYFQSIESLRSHPDNEIYKNQLKLNGQQLVDDINRIYDDLESQEILAKTSLKQNVNEINGILEDIATVNDKIKNQGFASNDLLDRRDLLEKQLSSYVNISIDRDSQFYELKIGGEVAVRNNSARTLTIGEEYIAQKDRFINDDGSTSSILNGVTFDQEDKIVLELNNTLSVSVEYNETMTFDLDGDGTEETINVDETNYVRALAYKINTNPQLTSQIKAFNGNYTIESNGDKTTDDSIDRFLMLESMTPGDIGKFDARITFVESEYTTTKSTFTVTDTASISINSEAIQDSTTNTVSIVHSINLDSNASGETFEIVLDNNGSATGSSITFDPPSVTYNSSTSPKTINVPAGVTSFTITMDSDSTVDLNTEADYAITLTATGSQPTALTSTLTLNNTGTTLEQSNKLEVSSTAGDTLTRVSSIDSDAAFDGTTITHRVTLNGATTESTVMDITLNDDTGSYFSLQPTFTNGVTYDEETGQITIPAGVSSFSITMDTNELAAAGTDQNYQFSITDTDGASTGTIPVTYTSTLTINDTKAGTAKNIFKTEDQSVIGSDKIYLELFDEEIIVTNGKLKASLDNLTTQSGSNKFTEYKDSLDNFTQTFVDMASSYIKNGENDYVYGEIATDENPEIADDIGLFIGSSVRTLRFDSLAIGNLDQKDYDYLATMQWKDDISFAGFGQTSEMLNTDTELRSFSEFYQDLRVNVSRDKENSDFLVDTQKAITESLASTYDNLVKVDNDEEMVNLIKFQAAYTANAKIITVVDQMLNTLLGIR